MPSRMPGMELFCRAQPSSIWWDELALLSFYPAAQNSNKTLQALLHCRTSTLVQIKGVAYKKCTFNLLNQMFGNLTYLTFD